MPHLTLLHVDDALIVADKPAGLLSVPAGGAAAQRDSLVTLVQALYPDALIVHRLDAATSGLVLLARGMEMLRRLSLAFEQRVIGKTYIARVYGHVATDSGDIALPLGPDPDNRPRQRVDHAAGRSALTRYTVDSREGAGETATTRLTLKPLTGRSHQLRVHLQALGHPIVGDPLYAPPELAAQAGRMCLHAAAISFIHPEKRTPMQFGSPAPF
ncbi:RNA pseudouridine synthase [Azoarcus indigens]|uniref:Dual-specificity RNA pseudouridine synthase RluA n=1 Tax=Azoarcus indigens TaxID=29545 RepID=A0A4R6DJW2_9RHOO|nr:RluA family pseudouridine synthase [Azoarcus indigens]NMG66396.1 RNA pseudouridine synthase [Azoarcus indigens]TDN45071.1 ribosomal large subunit pseudouridine synthase A [Azoarcus indigens]